MTEGVAAKDRLIVARFRYRRMVRIVLLLGLLTGFSLASQFVSILGAEKGVFPWFMTIITAVGFGFTVLLAQSEKARLDQAEVAARAEDAVAAGTPDPQDVTPG